MMGGGAGAQSPRAVIHKQILDVAESKPKASLEEIAAEVSGATMDIVERVLDEYGDPAENDSDSGESKESTEMSDENSQQTDSKHGNGSMQEDVELTEKQRATLRLIYENPDASQRDLAEKLDVTPSTVCNRLNTINGFDWENRQYFANTMFNGENANASDEQSLAETVKQLSTRVDDLEQRASADGGKAESVMDDPKFVHKVVHACMESEHITEEEELQLLKEFI